MLHSLTELIEKIMLGEDSTIEFKREMPPQRNNHCRRDRCFLRTPRGGVILVGVDD